MIPAPQPYRLDAELHLDLWRLTYRRSIPRVLATLAIVVGVLLGLVLPFGPDVPALLTGAGIGCLVLAGLMIGQYWLLLRRQSSRVFNESVNLREQQTLTVDAEGFQVDQASAHARHRWADIVKWDETPKIFAIFPNRLIAYAIPKAQVDAATIDFARQQLVASGLGKEGRLRK